MEMVTTRTAALIGLALTALILILFEVSSTVTFNAPQITSPHGTLDKEAK